MYYVKTNTLNISNEAVASVASHVGLATPLHRHMSDFYFIYLSDNCPFQDDSYWYSFQEFFNSNNQLAILISFAGQNVCAVRLRTDVGRIVILCT
jgi:hypothetical protein